MVCFHFECEHSISRVLYRLHGDDYLSSQPIAWLLKRRNPEGQRAASTLPYSVLLQMGFTKPAGLPTAGALLPHLSTLTTCVAVSFSMALSLGSPPPDVIRHPALRSSDFPHALRPAIIFPAREVQYSMGRGKIQAAQGGWRYVHAGGKWQRGNAFGEVAQGERAAPEGVVRRTS